MNNAEINAKIDAEIRALVRRRVSPGEPSADFATRVLAATGERAAVFQWPLFQRPRLSWRAAWATSGLVVAIGVAIGAASYFRQEHLGPGRLGVPPEVMTLSRWHSPTESLLGPPAPGVPRLGERYFQINTNRGGTDAK